MKQASIICHSPNQMPLKGPSSTCSIDARTRSFSPSPRRSPSVSTPMIERMIEAAATMIKKWDTDGSTYTSVTSLFLENKEDAMRYLSCVTGLQKTMHHLVTRDPTAEKLVYLQTLMEIAMKRLQKEFYQILSTNRAYLDPESISSRSSGSGTFTRSSTLNGEEELEGTASLDDDGDHSVKVEEISSTAMSDLRSIAECMISAGYSKECMNVYKIIRKSIIDEGIYSLGVKRVRSSWANKADSEAMETRIRDWLVALKISIKMLFHGERILCDHIFASSDCIRESCFSQVSREGAALLFRFPELIAKSKTKASTPERMFQLLDMYAAIWENWAEIESIFSFKSTSIVRIKALSSLIKLSETLCTTFIDLESSIHKDLSKTPVSGGDVHHLTKFAMTHLSKLGNYHHVLSDIMSDWPRPEKSTTIPAISFCFAKLLVVLLCQLDCKAKQYKDVTLSYLFLANNLNHVVSNVRTSNLHYILGKEWIVEHENKLIQYVRSYEQLAWSPVVRWLPKNPSSKISPEEARVSFRRFNASFEEACKKQSGYIFLDPKLRERIYASVSRYVSSAYCEFYEKHNLVVEEHKLYSPEAVEKYISNLFAAT